MRELRDLDAVRAEVRRIVSRRKQGTPGPDLSRHEPELEALLDSIESFLPVWTALPSVYRLARIDTGGATAAYADSTALPAAKHTLELVVEMLNHIRKARGLEPVTMPLLLQPDDIELALASPAECHCDEEQEVAARARSLSRLGRRGSKRWLYTGQDVLDRDGRRCTRCGVTKDLHVHATGTGTKWTDPAGYVTLCRRCHVVEGAGQSPAAAALAFHLDDGRVDGEAIRSQLALVFQKGALNWIALAFGPDYVVLKA